MSLIDKYLEYIANVRRYSRRTQEIYAEVLKDFTKFAITEAASPEQVTDLMLKESLTPLVIRGYEMNLLDKKGLSPRTVNLHISVLSGLCRFLMKTDILTANPAKAVSRPKQEKRLPVFYRKDAMAGYFAESDIFAGEDILTSPEEFMERYTAAKSRPGYRIEMIRYIPKCQNLQKSRTGLPHGFSKNGLKGLSYPPCMLRGYEDPNSFP